MAVTYYAILTNVGAAKLANAAALGTTLQITQMAVGDGGGNVPVPDASRTTLVNEVRRAPLNQLKIDPSNASQVIAEQVIPESVGGWWIREMGLLDSTGALIAIANCAPSYKPQLAEGSGRTQTVRMVLIVNNTGSVELKIDPSVVLATREYCDNAITTAINRQDAKASVRAATTANIALNGLPTVDGVVLAAGDRVLVKNQGTGSQNGIYVAAAGTWARSADADENAEVTPSLTVSVESGTTLADTIWQLITDAPIVVGATALVFQDITNGLARLASPTFTGTPTAPTAAPGANSQQLATTEFVTAALVPKAPLASPVFTGDPKAPTAAQFDNDTSLATTAFVQQAIGNRKQAIIGLTAGATINASQAGSLVTLGGSGSYTVITPTPNIGGMAFEFVNYGTAAVTLSTPAGNFNGAVASPGATSILVPSASSVTIICDGTNWLVNSGNSVNLLGSNGYQKLPSGLIIQWGLATGTTGQLAAAYPITFPNAVLQATATLADKTAGNNGGITLFINGVNFSSKSQISINPNGTDGVGTISARYIAIGY